ncbi:hypothetical protein MBLNU457_3092t2 [Dothideomycetes sp. NU457]
MNYEHHRKLSNAPAPAPPAPPLPPPPHYAQQAKSALHRVFGFGPRVSDRADSLRSNILRLPNLTSSNATASHRTGLEINSLSINDTGTHALLAGKEIFKTVRVDQGTCTEDANIRAAIRTYDANASENVFGSARPKDAVDIHDVAWAKGTTGNFVAAATSNGVMILYDLNRLGIEIARLFDHRRQVHRVTFNPHAGWYMLSASQDGTVRLWDIRDHQRKANTFTSHWSTPGMKDGIRDVKWSPTEGTEFALGTDGGWIQKWDIRNNKVAKQKIAAHSNICSTIDWHPDGKHLLSASADKTVRVWNLAAEGKGRKPNYEVKTPYPLRNARWRPPCQSSMGGDGALQSVQFVTSYDKEYPMLHVWDLRRPALPFREIECYQTSPTDLLWHSQDLLWTVGKEGTFLQTDVKFSRKVLDKRNMQSFALSPLGDIDLVTQRRSLRRRPSPPPASENSYHRKTNTIDFSKFDQQTQERMSRGSADDSVDDAFLSAKFKHTRRRSGTYKEPKSFGSTPPSASDYVSDRTLRLDEIMSRRKSFRPNQSATRGVIPGVSNPLLRTYLAQKYKLRPYPQPPTVNDLLAIGDVFEKNAEYARLASMYRIAQSWKIVGQIVSRDVHRRAEQQRQNRLRKRYKQKLLVPSDSPVIQRARKLVENHKEQSSKPNTPVALPVRGVDERTQSTSNVPTPVARPTVTALHHGAFDGNRELPDVGSDATLSLPPSIVSPDAADDHPVMQRGLSDTRVQKLDHDVDHEDSQRLQVGDWRPPRRQPLTLEPLDSSGMSLRPNIPKHDSDESFGMFPSISSSRVPSLPDSLASSKLALMDMVGDTLRTDESAGLSKDKTLQYDADEAGVHFKRTLPSQNSFASDASIESPVLTRSLSSEIDHMHITVGQPPSTERPVSRRAITHDIGVLSRNNQESFSSESDVHSQGLFSLREEAAIAMEASGTIVPDLASQRNHPRGDSVTKPTSLNRANDSAPPAFDDYGRNTDFIVSDFFSATSVEQDPEVSPITLVTMLKELLVYHTRTLSDAQTSSALILLLSPLLPETHPLNSAETDATLSHYLDHLSSLNLSDPYILSILSSQTSHLISAGLSPLFAESILSTYHEQLLTLNLVNNAAYLRRLAYPTYPSVYELGLKENQTSLRCGSCKRPITNGRNRLLCENCGRKQRSCTICWCEHSPFESVKTKKTGALEDEDEENGHAHTACLDAWHGPVVVESESPCPTAGCGCFCISSSGDGTPRPSLSFTSPPLVQEGARRTSVGKRELHRQGSGASGTGSGLGRAKQIYEDELVAHESRAVGSLGSGAGKRALLGGGGRKKGS